MIPELAIPKEKLVKVHVHKLDIGVRNTYTKMARVQL